MNKYIVAGWKNNNSDADFGFNADIWDDHKDTRKEATQYAKYILSDIYQQVIESSNPITLSRVYRQYKNGKLECLEEFSRQQK